MIDIDDDGETVEDGGTYAAQLHRVFEGCDRSGTGLLGRAELIELCGKLHLQDQTGLVLGHLLAGDDPEAKLDFDEFKDKFVCLLTQSVHDQQHQQQAAEHDLVATSEQQLCVIEDKDAEPFASLQEREVDPKYVWGSKKYGRRSRPDAVDSSSASSGDGSGTDSEDFPSNSSSSDVFIPAAVAPRPSSNHVTGCSASGPGVDASVAGATGRPRASSFNGKQMAGAKRRRRMESHDEFDANDAINRQHSADHSYNKDGGLMSSDYSGSADNEEEYLRSIWLKLGVGTDGYLDLEGLTQVCEHIGMEKMSEEVVDQLFDKLDVDRDGRIHFDEFMHLFRTGEASQQQHNNNKQKPLSSSTDNTTSSNPLVDQSPTGGVGCSKKGDGGSNDSTSTNVGCIPGESGIFGSIDPHSTGYAEQEAVLELWDSLGITDGYGILKELGFHESAKICLLDLTHVLEDILQMANGEPELTHAAFVCHTHELKFLRRTVHQLRLERDYLLVDVADANSRAMLIAQEVDENQAKLEQKSQENLANLSRKYQDQVRRLKEELECEQDTWNEQVAKLRTELQGELASRQEADARHRERLLELEKEVLEAVRDKQNLERRLADTERRHQERQMEEEESFSRPRGDQEEDDDRSEEGRSARLSLELEMMKSANKQLQDRNDELSVKVEKLKTQLASKLTMDSPASPPQPSPSSDLMTSNETSKLLLIPSNRQTQSAAAAASIFTAQPTSVQVSSADGSVGGSAAGGGGHRRSSSWLSDYVKVERGKPTGVFDDSCCVDVNKAEDVNTLKVEELDERLSSLSQMMMLNGDCWSDVDDPQQLDVENEDEEEEEDEDEEEYRPFRSTSGHVKRHEDLQKAVQKLEVKKVFNILKRRFIENYLDEMDQTTMDTKNHNHMSPSPVHVVTVAPSATQGLCKTQNAVKIMSDSGFEDNGVAGHSNSNSTTPSSRTNNGHLDDDIGSTPERVKKRYEIAVEEEEEEYEEEEENQLRPTAGTVMQQLSDSDKLEGTGDLSSQPCKVEHHWQTVIDSERQNWVQIMLSVESRCLELQEKLEAKDACLKTNLLKSEVFWRDQIGQERAEMENERMALENTILQLQFQLDNVRKSSKDVLVDANKSPTKNDNDDTGINVAGGVAVSRSKSCRDHTCCRREVTIRRCFSGRSSSSSASSCASTRSSSVAATKTTTSEDEVPGFDTDSLEEKNGDKKKLKSGCPHRVPCCAKLDLCKWQLVKSEQRRQCVERDLQRIQLEFLTRGTSLEQVHFQPSSEDDNKSNCVVDMEMLHAINQHVRQQEQRCRQLEAAMATGQLQANNELRETRRVNDEELRRLTQLLSKTRALLKEQTTKVRDQNEKLLQSDMLVKELYVENAQLIKRVQSLEENQRVNECANFALQHKVHTLNQLLTEMFRSPAPSSL